MRSLLPADLYVAAWLDPSPAVLTHTFEHLRTLHRILHDYVPPQISLSPPDPGEVRHEWQEGTLMFTDLAGFTPLMEANATRGRAGAEDLLGVLNTYFAETIEIISKSGGNLLEFTGDALLAQFPADQHRSDTARAVRAGLRMQRAMARFANLEMPHGAYSLGMRAGLHVGRFLMADIGTPRRMEHVLLGSAVQRAKKAEGAGQVGRVCLSETACDRVRDQYRLEPGTPEHMLVVDDLADDELGEYDVSLPSRRRAGDVLLDRTPDGLLAQIEEALTPVERLASYLPMQVLSLLVENAAHRQIPPDFPTPTVTFVDLIGFAGSVDEALAGEEASIVSAFSRAVSLINAAVEARGGLLKKVTYHLAGPDMMICFGVPTAHTDDPARAADAALAVRDIVTALSPLTVGNREITMACQTGIAHGACFAAEIGEPRGRREFNVLGDPVNTAARLMSRAAHNQILMTEPVYEDVAGRFDCEALGAIPLKGKAAPTPLFALLGRKQAD